MKPTIEGCLTYLNDYIANMSESVPPDNQALVFHKAIRAQLEAAQAMAIELEDAVEQLGILSLMGSKNAWPGASRKSLQKWREAIGIQAQQDRLLDQVDSILTTAMEPSQLRLHAGELTSREVLGVKAVLSMVRCRVSRLKTKRT